MISNTHVKKQILKTSLIDFMWYHSLPVQVTSFLFKLTNLQAEYSSNSESGLPYKSNSISIYRNSVNYLTVVNTDRRISRIGKMNAYISPKLIGFDVSANV